MFLLDNLCDCTVDNAHRKMYNMLVPYRQYSIKKRLLMTPNKDFIRKLVKERSWSDSELARQMGVSRSEVNRFLHGERCCGKKLISGLLKAFPKESIETLFIFPIVYPIGNTNGDLVVDEDCLELIPVKNLNNALVAKMDAPNGLVEVAERGYVTRFKMPEGTDRKRS